MARGTRNSVQSADKVTWKDEERVGFLADAIIAVMTQLGKQDLTFKSQEWTDIKDRFNDLANVNYDKIKLQTYLKNRKKDYHDFTYLKNQSGFGWIADLFIVTAPDDVWEPILQVKPELKKWKGISFWHFDKWSAIFDGRVTTGELRQEGRKRSRVSATDRIVESFKELASTIMVAAVGTSPAAVQPPPPTPSPAVDSATQKRNQAWAILNAEPFISEFPRKDLMKVKRVFIHDVCEAELFLQSDEQDRILYVEDVLQ